MKVHLICNVTPKSMTDINENVAIPRVLTSAAAWDDIASDRHDMLAAFDRLQFQAVVLAMEECFAVTPDVRHLNATLCNDDGYDLAIALRLVNDEVDELVEVYGSLGEVVDEDTYGRFEEIQQKVNDTLTGSPGAFLVRLITEHLGGDLTLARLRECRREVAGRQAFDAWVATQSAGTLSTELPESDPARRPPRL